MIRVAEAPPTTDVVDVTNSGDINDEQLIQQVANRDSAALEHLYDRYASAVMGLAFKMLGERTLAEEVVQETFWRIWSNAESFQTDRGKFSSWMFGIARNLSVDKWRRGQKRPQPVPDSDNQLQRVGESNVAESVWTAMKHKQVRTAMKALPPAQRQVIELAYFWGMTRQEISEETNVPLGTVHTRARSALHKLRDILQAQGFEG